MLKINLFLFRTHVIYRVGEAQQNPPLSFPTTGQVGCAALHPP